MFAALGVHAQSWWTPPGSHRYNDETVVYATLQLNGWPASYSNQHYRVAAFVGDECRAVADAPVEGEDGNTLFVLRVAGDRPADRGKPIRFEVCSRDNDYGLAGDVTPSMPVVFDGESWGRPSAPIVMQGDVPTAPLQAFAVSIGHVAVGETTTMTLTPIPADAAFALSAFHIHLRSASPDFAAWQPADIRLLSRQPLTYHITGLVPGWVDIQILPSDGREAYPLYADAVGGAPFTGFHVDERLSFSEGWQWCTNPYGTLDASNLEAVFGPWLVEARTQQELLCNDPEQGYFGTIMTGEGIPQDMAYKVKMQRRAVSYVGSGSADHSWAVPLEEGWTWIPSIYFYDRRLTTAFAAARLPEGTVIVSKDQGSAEWNGREWEGDLQVMTTRQSFLCYYPDETPGLLSYAPEAMMAQGHETPTADPQPSTVQTAPVNSSLFTLHSSLQDVSRRFRDNMTMVASLNPQPSTLNPPPSTLLAYVGAELRGVGCLINGRYHLTIHADGGERVSLRLQDADGREWPVDEQFTVGQQRLGSLRQPVALHSQALLLGIAEAELSASSRQPAAYYDLQGRRVLHPQKDHIYIINHKKVKL